MAVIFMDTYSEIAEILENENIKYNKEDLKKVVEYAENSYVDKKKGNIDMLEHVVGVAKEVALLRIDDVSVYAAILHGVVKCDNYDSKKIRKEFGNEIVDIIETADKLSCLNLKGKEKVDNEILRNMFLAIAKDIRTVILKLSDRLYNMRNINSNVNREDIKVNMAKECLKVYAPIAHRLGMSKVKSELEDISFRILMPDEYAIVKKQIDEKKKEREKYIEDRISEINISLKEQNIEATVYGRPKHFYSIYKKMTEKHYTIDDLFDLLAIRVIVNSIKDCYSVLGILHDKYKPMPGRFKDYIAVPKINMYQSLHTTVFGEGGRPFEIQIRTWDMHNIAERGVAAHFSYKEKTKKVSNSDQKIIWLRQTLEMQKEISDNTQNLAQIKSELFGEEVFVFTPQGDIKSLVKGSSVIDFAYLIHQKVAENMIGAKVNGKMVPISTKLENTDVVEIITSSTGKGPNRDWLKYVKTSNAKNKITSFLKKQGRDINIAKGKELFEKEFKKKKLPKEILNKEDLVKKSLKQYNFNTLEEAYENIGFGSISPLKIVNRLKELYDSSIEEKNPILATTQKNKKNKVQDSEMIEVENISNCKVKFAKCCMPIPGDDIVGYITLSNGVSVHRKDCKSLLNLDYNKRKINVKWKNRSKAKFLAKIRIKSNNRNTLISDVISKLNELKLDTQEFNTKVLPDREVIIEIGINVLDIETLQKCIRELRKIDSIFDVRRMH
jgi:GTP pyrophosphokinase